MQPAKFRLIQRHFWAIVAVGVLATSVAGCGDSQPPATSAKSGPANSNSRPAKLRLLVVGDPAIAQRITRLRGEWLARSGSQLEVSEMPESDLGKIKHLAADVVIYPCDALGTLAENRLILPLGRAWLDRSDRADFFELPGERETAWGEQIYAVPLGSPVLVCLYRADVFARGHLKPPASWAEYQQLVEKLTPVMVQTEPPVQLPDFVGTLEPLAAGWAGKVLLARAAGYAKHREYYSTLFDKDTLEPRIASEPFVRALSELMAAAKLGPKTQLDFTPANVRREFFTGHAMMALSWPTANDESLAGGLAKPTQLTQNDIAFCELPGSTDVFSPREQKWTTRQADDEPHVPLLSVAGRMGSIVRGSPAADSAFELLVWLSGNEWSSQISPASPATTLFRRSQLAHIGRWVEPDMSPAAAKQYGDVAAASLSRAAWLICPRIPAHDEYMRALDDAVRRAVEGKATPADALKQAAAQWQTITDRIGRDAQTRAYVRSLGLEP